MVVDDIGTMIFVEILGMTQYPGSPFTGQIINDLVMFLFVPTVFIIVVIFTLVGRLTDNAKIKLLLSIALYLFIIFGGYYPIFALLAGPYFIFLIIIIGLLFFFFGHFGLRRGGGEGGQAQGMPGRALMATGTTGGEMIFQYEQMLNSLREGEIELERLERESKTNPALDRSLAVQRQAVMDAKREVKRLELEIGKMRLGHGIEARMKELQRRYGTK